MINMRERERENLYVLIYTCSAHLAALDAVRCAGTLWSPASVLHAVHLSQDVRVGAGARSIQYHNTGSSVSTFQPITRISQSSLNYRCSVLY